MEAEDISSKLERETYFDEDDDDNDDDENEFLSMSSIDDNDFESNSDDFEILIDFYSDMEPSCDISNTYYFYSK